MTCNLVGFNGRLPPSKSPEKLNRCLKSFRQSKRKHVGKIMPEDFDLLLNNYDDQIRELAIAARELITKLTPKADEKVYFGWRVARYSLDGTMASQFIAIGPQKKHVNLYFMNGVELDDPKGLMSGVGKKMRHVSITDAKQLKSAALKALIKLSAKLQQTKLS